MTKLYRIDVQPGDAYVIPGDMHFPFQDRKAVLAMWEWVHARRAADVWNRVGLLLQGDTIDCYGLSRFGKKARKMWDHGRLMSGINAAEPFLRWGAKLDLGATMLLGNHEYWAASFVNDNPALEGCPGTEFARLTGLDQIEGLEVLDHDSRVLLGRNCVVAHGHDLGARTPDSIVNRYPDQFTILGHWHKVWSRYRTVYAPDGTPAMRGAACVGMMASPEAHADYAPDGDMQLGFAVVEFKGRRSNGAPFFRVDLHTIQQDGGKYVVC
jgi:hypothetical protein